MRKGVGFAFLGILILIVFFCAIYFTFFFHYKCDSLDCYLAQQENCKRTSFINDVEGITWLYQIQGEDNGKCEVEVEVLQVKKGDASQKKLEELSMNCFLSFYSRNMPEADIELCHGRLKEELQGIIIKKLHDHILDNLGEIGEKLETAI